MKWMTKFKVYLSSVRHLKNKKTYFPLISSAFKSIKNSTSLSISLKISKMQAIIYLHKCWNNTNLWWRNKQYSWIKSKIRKNQMKNLWKISSNSENNTGKNVLANILLNIWAKMIFTSALMSIFIKTIRLLALAQLK